MISHELADLEQRGWARYDRDHILGTSDESLDLLRSCFADLPRDSYAPGSNRYRRVARAVYLPWIDQLSWVPHLDDPEHGPVVEYDMQGYNSEFTGIKRQFPAIAPDILDDPLLRRIIRFDLERVMWFKPFHRTPLNVGIDCMMLTVEDPTHEAVATPNALHQDGGSMKFGFIHLIVRRNVRGGVNYIASPRCVGFQPDEVSSELIDAEFTLEEPLDTLAIHDSRSSHHVSAVRKGDEPSMGQRGVLLVGISPLAKRL